jgi:hypothetical protein
VNEIDRLEADAERAMKNTSFGVLANPAVVLNLIARLRASEAAEAALMDAYRKIAENEEDGYGACRYCGAESYAVDTQGVRIAGENYGDAVEFHIDHDLRCPVTILSDAYPS